jgi:hypothetical protein
MDNYKRHIVGGMIIGLTADSQKEDRKEEPKPEEVKKPSRKKAPVKK